MIYLVALLPKIQSLKVGDDLRKALQIDIIHFDLDKDDRSGRKFSESTGGLVPAYFGYQRDTAVGLSYDIQNNLRLKMEYHWNTGTGRLGPNVVPDIVVNTSRHHQLWAVQLMYWF